MVAVSPDRGLTLEGKEKHYFETANGAIFIITPGSERLGSLYPSPSVSHEMGQAKQKFAKKPECVVYLVDKNCNLPTIDQQSSIVFDRSDARSILSALTQLLKDLKSATLFRTAPIPTQVESKPRINLEEFCNKLSEQIKQALLDISNLPNGYIGEADLTKLLTSEYQLNMQSINFLKRDLESYDLVVHSVTGQPYFLNGWFLSNLGWDVVRFEVKRKRELERKALNGLLGLINPSGGLGALNLPTRNKLGK
jgi:hypothetical protein